MGVIGLAFIGSLLASLWPVRLGELYNGISDGAIGTLAQAFLRRPKLYIFDESTANLDEQTAAAVLTNLERHAAADGAGILYISHDQNVVDRCDQVIVLTNSIASHSPGPEKAAPGCACTLPS